VLLLLLLLLLLPWLDHQDLRMGLHMLACANVAR
jgi:hypothetical protein